MAKPNASAASSRAPTIDINGYYPFCVSENAAGQTVLELDLNRASNVNFLVHMQELMTVRSGGESLRAVETKGTTRLHFVLPKKTSAITVFLREEPVSQLRLTPDGMLVEGDKHREWQLAVGETRALGMGSSHAETSELRKIPYRRAARDGFDPRLHAPLTDIHTHASAQIGAADLLQIALEADQAGPNPIAYPLELLQLLGAPPEAEQETVTMRGRNFTPLREEGLLCEQEGASCSGVRIGALSGRQKDAIVTRMQVMPDRTMLFSDFDRQMYRYRNPLVRHPALTRAMIKKIAEEYAVQGIRYAELSTGSMTDPEWFRQMSEAVEQVEKEGGPTLRFLIGLPRNVAPFDTQIALEKVKYLARHPYIVGVDLLGYEANKTSDFHWALAHIAQWAESSEGTDLTPEHGWNFKRDFTLRVHAGETTKNPENVRDAIRIAEQYGVRVRVAHTLNATLDPTAHGWLKEMRNAPLVDGIAPDLMTFELCPDSNQAYRTKPLVHNSPILRRLKHAEVVLGSDGAGAINTDNRQLAYSAIAAGTSLEQLAQMRRFEEGFTLRQRQREAIKRTAFTARYGAGREGFAQFLEGYREKLAALPRGDELPRSFAGKRPIFIGGASGSSWTEMSEQDHIRVRQLMQFLVRVCDPKKIYFVLGRVQDAGVSRALDVALKQYNREHPREKFDLLGRYAGAANEPTGEIAESISWVQPIAGGRDAVPGSMLKFLKARKGMMVCCDGGNFTAEMIAGAGHEFYDIAHALMIPTRDSPVAHEAELMPQQGKFRDLREFIGRVLMPVGAEHLFRDQAAKAGVLREGMSETRIETAYRQAQEAAAVGKDGRRNGKEASG